MSSSLTWPSPTWLTGVAKVAILDFLRICYWRGIFDSDLGFRSIGYVLLGKKTELCWTQIWDPEAPVDVDPRLTLYFVLQNAKNLEKLSLSKAIFWKYLGFASVGWSSALNGLRVEHELFAGLSALNQARWSKCVQKTSIKFEKWMDSWTAFSTHRALKCLVIRETRIHPRMLFKFILKFPNLEILDLTLCTSIRYKCIVQLRANLDKLHEIRLLPEDLSGRVLTPFGPGGRDQIHTYYIDGTFDLARDRYSKGFCAAERMADGTYKVYHWFIEGLRTVVLVKRFPDHFMAANGIQDKLKHLTRFPKTMIDNGVQRIDKMPFLGGSGKQPPRELLSNLRLL